MTDMFEQTVFSVAHTDARVHPLGNQERTLRLVAAPNTRAAALKVKFSNEYGENPVLIGAATLALCDEEGLLHPGTLVPVTFGGKLGLVLAPGEEAFSDAVPFPLQPQDYFALSLYYPNEEKIISGNWVAAAAQRSGQGNFTATEDIPGLEVASRLVRTFMHSNMAVTLTSVCEIVALREAPGRTLACFGDSITQQGNWTVPFAQRLARAYPGEISLCNLGISGNRLLHPSPAHLGGLNGKPGIERFARNVLSLHGLTHAILELGSNDIGLPDGHSVPDEELITAADYIAGMEKLAAQLKERGVKAYVATIAPRAVDDKPFDEKREKLRQDMNALLRGSAVFDAVLDFDAWLRRPDGEPGMKEGCVLPDGLHPSPFGGMCIAREIDISLFGESC